VPLERNIGLTKVDVNLHSTDDYEGHGDLSGVRLAAPHIRGISARNDRRRSLSDHRESAVLAVRLAHNDIFFNVVHAGKILF